MIGRYSTCHSNEDSYYNSDPVTIYVRSTELRATQIKYINKSNQGEEHPVWIINLNRLMQKQVCRLSKTVLYWMETENILKGYQLWWNKNFSKVYWGILLFSGLQHIMGNSSNSTTIEPRKLAKNQYMLGETTRPNRE